MAGLVLGILIGILFVLLFGGVGGVLHNSLSWDSKLRGLCVFATIVSCITVFIFSIVLCCQFDRNQYDKWMKQFESTKQTIEESLNNDSLSGFERVELVKQATEKNEKLISRQYDCQKWYGFNISNRILEIKPISLE